MANVKISELTAATTPLAGTEVLPIVQSSATVKVSVANLTAGRAISALSLNNLTVGYGAGAVSSNTAVGVSALASNTTGSLNVAVGDNALPANTTGSDNTAVGRRAGQFNTTGSQNTMLGVQALALNTSGAYNTAVGVSALQSNTTASNNTAVGYQAGYSTTTGGSNTFIGQGAGNTVTSGTQNTIIGRYGGNEGGLDIRTASGYIVLSDGAGNPRGYFGTGGNFVITRTTFSSLQAIGCYQDTTGSAANVFISSSGDFVRSTSSRKYKKDIETATHGLAELLTLRPVTYKGTGNHDSEQVLGGLIAEEVHEAGLTEFVQYAEDGTPDALAYGHMVSLCVKAIQELKAEIDQLKGNV